jgi:hypothetical protein
MIRQVFIWSQATGPAVQECKGPGWSGACPYVAAGEPVACAGLCLLALLQSGRRVVLEVEPDARTCPLAAFRA